MYVDLDLTNIDLIQLREAKPTYWPTYCTNYLNDMMCCKERAAKATYYCAKPYESFNVCCD